jgi:hypothetical protein
LLLDRLAVVRRREELLALRLLLRLLPLLAPLLLPPLWLPLPLRERPEPVVWRLLAVVPRLLLDARLRLLLWLPLALVLRLLPLLWLPLALVLRLLPLARRLDPLWRALAEACLLPLLDRLLLVLVADRDAELERPRLLARFDVPRSLAGDISPSCFRLTLLGRFWRLEQVCLGATRGRTPRTPLDECSSQTVSEHGQPSSPGSRTIE